MPGAKRFPMPKDLVDRWWLRVRVREDGCWEWIGARWRLGYGKFNVGERRVAAHRFGYEMLVGPIPEGLDLDHLCRNPWCVNPDHLEPVTRTENTRRGIAGITNAARQRSISECPAGHPYDEENTYYAARGSRNCRACDRQRRAERRAS